MTWLRNGGWIVIPLIVITAVVAWWQVRLVREHQGPPQRGDGATVASYGYDLSTLSVDEQYVAASGLSREGLEPLDHPPLMAPEGVADVRPVSGRAKYLVPSDRVVGVRVGPHARAYPVRVLAWHEVVNDTLGGVPIVVSFSPKADVAAAYDRRVDGIERTFLFSGLVHRAVHLLVDVQDDPAAESLWSPLLGRSVSGPADGAPLDPVAFVVDHWGEWTAANPHTTVIDPDRVRLLQYRQDPYGSYLGHDELPDWPLPELEPPAEDERWKDRVFLVRPRSGSGPAMRIDSRGPIPDGFTLRTRPHALVPDDPSSTVAIPMMRFVFDAHRPLWTRGG